MLVEVHSKRRLVINGTKASCGPLEVDGYFLKALSVHGDASFYLGSVTHRRHTTMKVGLPKGLDALRWNAQFDPSHRVFNERIRRPSGKYAQA